MLSTLITRHFARISSEAYLKQVAPTLHKIMYEFHDKLPTHLPVIKGPEPDKCANLDDVLNEYGTTAIQATMYNRAENILNEMLRWRLSHDPITEEDSITDPALRAQTSCGIYLGFTSNVMYSGLRDIMRFLVQHKLVNEISTTGASVEVDLLKCMGDVYMADPNQSDIDLYNQGLVRNGNFVVKNNSYVELTKWLLSQFPEVSKRQAEGYSWTPAKLIHFLGEKINDQASTFYWASKNNIMTNSPGITDSRIGDALFLYNQTTPKPIIIDTIEDLNRMYTSAVDYAKRGALIIGGATSKHQILLANIVGGGLNYAVLVSTTQEFDASDGGAPPEEGKSWGKMHLQVKAVKLFSEASLVVPLLVSRTFVPYLRERDSSQVRKFEQIRVFFLNL